MDFEIKDGILVKYTGTDTEVVIPDDVKEIGKDAFQHSHITSVKIPGSVKVIGEGAFSGCPLKEIDIEEGVTTIKKNAFMYTGANHGNHIGVEPQTRINLPDSLKTIGKKAFDRSEIRSANIKSLESWLQLKKGEDFFMFLNERVIMENGIIPSGHRYHPCGYTDTPLDMGLFVNGERLTRLRIPDSITSIPSYAFNRCPGLTEVVIPPHVTSIGKNAFDSCYDLKRVEIQGKTSIETYAFNKCVNLTEVILSDEVENMDRFVFDECQSLSKIRFPSGMINIPQGTFSGCINLSDVMLSDNLQRIDSEAFCRCIELKSISLPASLSSIRSNAFSKTGLERIELPEGVEDVSGAFESCKNLQEVVIPSTVNDIWAYAFDDCPSIKKMVIRCSLDSFKGDTIVAGKKPKDIYIREDQLKKAKALFKNAKFFNLDGKPIKGQMAAAGENSSDTAAPIIRNKAGEPTGFVKPSCKELTTQFGTVTFTVTIKISAKLPAIWKRYYLTKDQGAIYDPAEALKNSFYNTGYVDDSSGTFVSTPLENNIYKETVPLSGYEVTERLSAFVVLLNQCVSDENIKKIIETAEKKKNGKLYKGRILHLCFLDLVDNEGTTYELVAKNEDDTNLLIELRSKVPVTNDLLSQEYLLK